MGVSLNGGTPKSSILIGFSIINHPFWGTPIFGNTQLYLSHWIPWWVEGLATRKALRDVNAVRIHAAEWMKFVGKVDVFGVLSQAQRCAKTAGGCHVGSGSEDGSPWGKLDGLESVA